MGDYFSVSFTYKDFFGEEPNKSIEELIINIDREKALLFIANLNAQSHMPKDLRPQLIFLQSWISDFSTELKERIIEVIQPHIDSGNLNFIHQPASLHLIQKLIEKGKTTGKDIATEQKIDLLKAYLISSEIYVEKDIPPNLDVTNTADFIKWSLETQLPISDLKKGKKFYIQIFKSVELFSFFESYSSSTQDLLSDYLEAKSFSSWNEYLRSILLVYTQGLFNANQEIKNALVNTDGEKFAHNLLDQLCIDETNYSPQKDFIELRDKPILKIEENLFLVLSIDLFLNKIFDGIIFDIHSTLRGNNYEGFDISDLGNFKSFLGDNFIEEVLLYKVLDFIKQKDWETYQGEDLLQDHPGSPDYLIKRKTKIFIIESKDILINKDIKYSRDLGKITNYLFSRLIKDKDNSPKGISQILNYIGQLVNKEVENIDFEHSNNLKYYPIVIVTDKCLDENGINNWLIDQFTNLRKGYSKDVQIKLPVILQLDDLIEHSHIYKSGTLKLNSIFDAYLDYLYTDSHQHPFKKTDPYSNFISRTKREKFKNSPVPENSIIRSSIDMLLQD
ncbi:hypothetical protein [Gracilimonas sp.]|uniref:hypothetical protein n=1 Tax=Gracilimonas sp. TaxID=1974203 RepID=UPI003BAAADDA